ncbi:MAG: type 1 glutamine amidotransferase [Phycisphaeraceae bacterium]|nr:type 1 glutamine amidotransferase [Phycisphaerales bacterium]MCB9860163.1 type 1 glutamine amidotransferase [Phycisphaeraceae bacterium]
MSILVFQHHKIGVPGRLGMTLRDHGFKLDIRQPNLHENAVPKSIDDVQALIVLGGPQNACDEDFAKHPWLVDEVNLIKQAHEAELPIIGICLGSQLIAHALGGKVSKMPKPECGMTEVSLTSPGQTEPVLAGIAWNHPQFQSHHWQVEELPDGATLLATNNNCKVQAYRAGLRTFGFQFHFECDREDIGKFLELEREGLSTLHIALEAAQKDADHHYEMYARLSNRLCVNLATLLFPLAHRRSA